MPKLRRCASCGRNEEQTDSFQLTRAYAARPICVGGSRVGAIKQGGTAIHLQDIYLRDMIRQEPILATLRRPRMVVSPDRQARTAQYRDKAEELRTVSEDVILEQTRLTLLRLAETYDRMANALELATHA